MLKLIKGMRIVAATHNPGKVPEIRALLGGHYEVVTAGSLNIPEPDETETTFVGNALLKARHSADLSGEVALADDSGLSVAALDGVPGIYSARWAGPDKDFAFAMRKVEERLEEIGSDDRRAWFTSALAVAWPLPSPRLWILPSTVKRSQPCTLSSVRKVACWQSWGSPSSARMVVRVSPDTRVLRKRPE